MRLAQLRDIFLKMIVNSICRAAATRHIPIDREYLQYYIYKACCIKRSGTDKAVEYNPVYIGYSYFSIDSLSVVGKDAENIKELSPYSVRCSLVPSRLHKIHVEFRYFNKERGSTVSLNSNYKICNPLHIWDSTCIKYFTMGLRVLSKN